MNKKPEFDPNQPFESPEVQQPISVETPGLIESGFRGLGQGATSGFGEETVAGAEALMEQLGGSKTPLGDRYKQLRDLERAKNEAAAKEHPWLYHGGEIAGGLGQIAFLGPLGKLGLLGKAAEGTDIGLKGMTALGAASGIGYGTADLTKGDVGGAAAEAGLGAAGGAAGYGIGKAVEPILGKIADKTGIAGMLAKSSEKSKKLGEKSILESMGANSEIAQKELAPSLREAVESGPTSGRAGFGEKASKVSTVFGGNEDTVKKLIGINSGLEDAKQQGLREVNNILQQKYDGTPSELLNQLVNRKDLAPKLEDAILKRSWTEPDTMGYIETEIERAQSVINAAGVDVEKLDEIKKAFNKKLLNSYKTNKPTLPVDEEVNRAVVDTINGRVEEISNFAIPNAGINYAKINKEQSQYIPLEQALRKKLYGEFVDTDTHGGKLSYLYSVAGYKLGGAAGSIVGGAAGMASKTFGENIFGKGLGDIYGAASGKASLNVTAPLKGYLAGKAEQYGQNIGMPITQNIVEKTSGAIDKTGQPTPSYAEPSKTPQQTLQNNRIKSNSNQPTLKVTSTLYTMSPDELNQLSQQLIQVPALAHYGNYLNRALQEGNAQRKDAALFALSQQKEFRDLMGSGKKR